ncbi:hypothetical protein AB0N07_33125 [Streptomyces sp. NPDC051172]|uniref:hypothetical protein n=1 Tax=Streptomyces sp. NPDC051172 TaxID=3155796 RepID=UPI00342085AC
MPQGCGRGLPRLARAAVFAAVCVVTTSLGHALMSGDTLPWWAIAYAFAGTVSGAWWLTDRERGAAAVVGATVVAQGLLHLFFDLAHRLTHAPNEALSPNGMVMQHAGSTGMPSHSMREPSGSPLPSVLTQHSMAGMVLVHLLAAVVCGLWLWRGEAATHRIGGALTAVVFAPLRWVCRVLFHAVTETGTPSCGPAFGAGEHHRPTPVSLRYAVVRRGPPSSRVGTQPPVSRSTARRTALTPA